MDTCSPKVCKVMVSVWEEVEVENGETEDEVLGGRVVKQSDVCLTTKGGKILGMGKTVEELGLEGWGGEVVVGRLRGGGFASGWVWWRGPWCRRRCVRFGRSSLVNGHVEYAVQATVGVLALLLQVGSNEGRKAGSGGVNVGAGVGQFCPKVRFNLEKAIREGIGSGSFAGWKGCPRGAQVEGGYEGGGVVGWFGPRGCGGKSAGRGEAGSATRGTSPCASVRPGVVAEIYRAQG